MERLFCILSLLSLAFVMTAVSFAQTPSAQQPKPEHLSKHQLNTLIATARTPAAHRRIAQYYEAKAQDYLAQSKEHEQMLGAYNQNSSASNSKHGRYTTYHCEYFVEKFKEMAAKSQELSQLHEQMARDAEQK